MFCLLYCTIQAAFVFRINGDYFGRAVAVCPPNVENVSFIFYAFLSSLGSHILCSTENKKALFLKLWSPGILIGSLVGSAVIPNMYYLENAMLTNSYSQIPVLVGVVWTCFLYISFM